MCLYTLAMAKRNTPSPKLVGVDDVATALGLDARRVQQLAADGTLPRAGHGKYDLRACVEAYETYKAGLTEEDGKRGSVDARRKLKAEADLAEHKAELARLEVEEEQGRLIPADQVADAWGKVLTTVKTRLLAIPSAIAPELQSLATVAEIEAHIRAAVSGALTTLADVGDELASALNEDEHAASSAAADNG